MTVSWPAWLGPRYCRRRSLRCTLTDGRAGVKCHDVQTTSFDLTRLILDTPSHEDYLSLISIIPDARGLPQALAAVRDCASTASSACETKEVRPRLKTAVP